MFPQVGKNISKYRQEKNMSKEEVAAIIGVDMSEYEKFESSEKLPEIVHLQKMAKAMNISIGEFLRGL